MKYLIKYKIFEDITEEEESIIIDDLNDILCDARDQNLEATVTSERRGEVIGDSLRVEIHGIFTTTSLCRIIMLKLTKATTKTETE